ncbi:hypothetical protein HQQ82_06270 [Rathayibacter sp. VKM Ac-2856]|uniref:hypothetical protein n=1 Tax=unclassified Rathayibacter TaxID=2609250 RepID=UPI0015676DD1|nr:MULTISPECIES: hypothetical protein [unclassified Rathayibacter]NQX04403.1 hypothetical protein [Rathayibacter sp. VKM Ac-2858]NQX19572.1 hypothetical protein [Rathayibacter sp. VKM Ac-2856]
MAGSPAPSPASSSRRCPVRSHHPVLLLAAVTLLAGCSSTPVVDVPASAVSASPSAAVAPSPTATATVAPSAGPELDCAAALPAAVVETGVGLPAETATLVQSGDSCSYGIAGNPAAVVVTVGPARLAETFQGAGEAVGAVPVPLGEAAYRIQGSATAPSELAVLAGGYELRVESFVGDQDLLAEWAVAVLDSLGVRLSAG